MQPRSTQTENPIRALLSRGQLFLEKCELSLAQSTFLEAYELAKEARELAAEITETVIEDDVQAAVVKYAEDLMRGSQRE